MRHSSPVTMFTGSKGSGFKRARSSADRRTGGRRGARRAPPFADQKGRGGAPPAAAAALGGGGKRCGGWGEGAAAPRPRPWPAAGRRTRARNGNPWAPRHLVGWVWAGSGFRLGPGGPRSCGHPSGSLAPRGRGRSAAERRRSVRARGYAKLLVLGRMVVCRAPRLRGVGGGGPAAGAARAARAARARAAGAAPAAATAARFRPPAAVQCWLTAALPPARRAREAARGPVAARRAAMHAYARKRREPRKCACTHVHAYETIRYVREYIHAKWMQWVAGVRRSKGALNKGGPARAPAPAARRPAPPRGGGGRGSSA